MARQWEQRRLRKQIHVHQPTYTEISNTGTIYGGTINTKTIGANKIYSEKTKKRTIVGFNSKTGKKRISYFEPETDDEEFEEESVLLFEPSELSTIRKMFTETEKISDGWEVKLLKWQQHSINQLDHGIQYPSKRNIHCILVASSIFYFKEENEQVYYGFLTADEIVDIQSRLISKFKMIEISNGVKEFVREIKRIDVPSNASKLRRGHRDQAPDYKLNNKNGTCTAVFSEVTSPKRQNKEPKVYWDIYCGATHAKDAIGYDISQHNI
ncbi:25457_t:CDS:2 [Gigaspora margarita]|uniref:25457_t:CDS:1 n=1 Tax=Gigaspora margarita TaxID=4874 RepID=A0ABN7UQT6_GIGMA|nr:25457_t:CDS:2 [Gigaspora margarita]